MTTIFYLSIITAPFILLFSAFLVVKKKNEGKTVKKAMRTNLAMFAVLAILISVLSVNVFAAEKDNSAADNGQTTTVAAENETKQEANAGNSKGMGLLAAGLVTGLAGIGGGIAVAAGAPAAIAATAENPKSFGKSIIFVALGESIALYGVVISILILQKV
ncbi:MAG: ATP synthase subunit C [Oscillospiraceae bacterium]